MTEGINGYSINIKPNMWRKFKGNGPKTRVDGFSFWNTVFDFIDKDTKRRFTRLLSQSEFWNVEREWTKHGSK
jgi:hypothetical protein